MLFLFSWYGFFCKAESCLCCHAAGVCNDFISDRKHAVILEHNCLKQKRVLCDTLYTNVCHMIGRGEYEGKLAPEVEMNCIKWSFAVFFFYASVLGHAPCGPLWLEQTTRFSRVRRRRRPSCSLTNELILIPRLATEKLLCVIRELDQSDGHFLFKSFQTMNTKRKKKSFHSKKKINVIGPFVKINYDMWAAVFFCYYYD